MRWFAARGRGSRARARRRARLVAALAALAILAACCLAYLGGIFKPVDATWQSLAFATRHDLGADPPISLDRDTGSRPWLDQCSHARSQGAALRAPLVRSPADAATLISACRRPLLLVAWDQASVGTYPDGWTRALTARLIDRLHAAGALLIVIDRLYEDQRAGTDKLAVAMRRAGNVVVAQEISTLTSPYLSGQQLVPLVSPIAAAARAIGLGNLPPPDRSDPRHAYRLYNNDLALGPTEPHLPSLALAAARLLGIGPASSDPTFAINFAGLAGDSFPTDSLADVLRGAVDPAEIAGRIVFVGDEYPLDRDYYPTPADGAGASTSGGQMYGVELNMHAFNTLLHRDPLRVPSAPVQILLGFPFACLAAAWAQRGRLTSVALLFMALLALLTGGSLLAFVAGGIWLDTAAPTVALIVAPLAVLGLRLGSEQRASRELRSLFGRYVAPGVVSRIVDDPDAFGLEGTMREVTVLFSDIRGFTTLSEGMSPQQVVGLLNRYFTAMVEEIQVWGGTVDKYVGDAIMALFGAPDDLPDAPARAVRAALGMQRRLVGLNERFAAEFGQTVAMGIGLHHGPAAVGIIGAPSKREYSAIGDTVNTASRLESFTKEAGYAIAASAQVVDALPPDLLAEVRPHDLGDVAVKGRVASVRIYGLGPPTGIVR